MKRGPQCSAQLQVLYASNSLDIFIFRNEEAHDHDIPDKARKAGLTDDAKKAIEEMFDCKMKPTPILLAMSAKGIPVKLSQLNNYIAYLRQKKFGPIEISLGQLDKCLQEKSNVPESSNSGYVIAYETNVHADTDEARFRFFMSSKPLLAIPYKSEVLHADATYKLVWQGFPCHVIGTTDRGKKFHPIGFGVASSETTEDFKFMFNAVKKETERLTDGLKYEPKVLVCDAAKSIQNAFEQVKLK